MKLIFSLLSLIFSVGTVLTQPILTEENNRPVIGDSYSLSVSFWDGTEPETGAEVTWDFSEIGTFATSTYSYADISDSEDYLDYPEATIAHVEDGALYNFEEFNSEGVFNLGFGVNDLPFSAIHSNSELILVYPMTMGTTASDDFAADFNLPDEEFERLGDVTISGIGYGTLILGEANIEHVLLVKKTSNFLEIYEDETVAVEIIQYFFYKPDVHFPLLICTSYFTEGEPSPYYHLDYNTSTSLSIKDDEQAVFSVFPNPVNGDLLNLNITNDAKIQKISIYNTAGELVYMTMQSKTTLDISQLNTGMYYIQVETSEGNSQTKFLKE